MPTYNTKLLLQVKYEIVHIIFPVYLKKKKYILFIFQFITCNFMFKILKWRLCINNKVYCHKYEVFLIYLKLRRAMKRKNNNLNKSYVNLHENMKDSSYFL